MTLQEIVAFSGRMQESEVVLSDIKYRRVLLKLSGEALMGEQSFGIDPAVPQRLAEEIKPVCDAGVQVAIVVGGGNIFRGIQGAAAGMDRAQGDNMGMLATVINSLSLQDCFERNGMGQVAQSWVGSGQNQPVSPGQLQQAIGPDMIRELAQRTGRSEPEVAQQLSQELPDIINRLTPQGRLPTQDEAHGFLNGTNPLQR